MLRLYSQQHFLTQNHTAPALDFQKHHSEYTPNLSNQPRHTKTLHVRSTGNDIPKRTEQPASQSSTKSNPLPFPFPNIKSSSSHCERIKQTTLIQATDTVSSSRVPGIQASQEYSHSYLLADDKGVLPSCRLFRALVPRSCGTLRRRNVS